MSIKFLLYFCAVCYITSNRATAQTLRAIPATVCNSNECRFGSCEIKSPTTYQCHCVSGVTGTNCDTQAAAGNPCSSNPCYAGGFCTNVGTTGFRCTCPNGLGGPQCRGVLNTCSCQNSGTCTVTTVNAVTVNVCNCPTGFGGNLCEYSVTPYQSCFTAGCLNGGTCTILSTCKCPTGFSGNRCQTTGAATTTIAPAVTNPLAISLCSVSGICQNGGACSQLSYNIGTCTCVNGYTGIYCNIPPTNVVNPTTSQACPAALSTFCQNQGTCTFNTLTNAISCRCQPNYSGPTCTTKVAFCSVANICKNGGICTTTNSPATGDGTCTCATGFSGTYCDISSCNAATTCNGRGVCVTNNGVNTCLCFAPYTGTNCQSTS